MTVYVLVALLAAGIKAGAPLLLGTLGDILTEKSGSLNLGVEGVMGISAGRPGRRFPYRQHRADLAGSGAGGDALLPGL